MPHTLTTCTFCGVGCGLYLETSGDRIAGVYPSTSHPTNEGRICLRGWHVHEVASAPDRIRKPLLRKDGRFHEVTWDEAFGFIVDQLQVIRRKHGPDSIAFLNSPRCSNEESYLLQKVARALIGTNNVDHGTGVYCNNSIQVLSDMLGVPATTNSIGELRTTDAIIADGIDLARQMPTIGGWVLRAKQHGTPLVVIDTRRHRIAESADVFLQLKPGTEALLYGAMAKVLVDRGLHNLPFIQARCKDYEPFLEAIRGYDLLSAAAACGLKPEDVERAALIYGKAKSAAILYSTGIESRSKTSIRALVNLALLAGQIGREGCGIFALTEQNNLQGVCDMGMLPDRFPGYQPVVSEAARASLSRIWGVPLSGVPGCGARAVLSDRSGGKIKAAWLCRYDPVSTAFFGEAAGALKDLEFVVCQHLLMTDTAKCADVVLPTTAFGEEQVTFTSTERRIQLAQKAINPPTGPMPAWRQLAAFARAWGCDWNYETAADVMDEIGQAVPFYSGASYANLEREYGRQWPCTHDKPLGTRFLFDDGMEGKPFRFAAVPVPAAPSEASTEYPFRVVFGHSLYYWNQNVLVRTSETLRREYRILLLDYPNGFVELNDGDAKELKIRDGERIRLRSATGTVTTAARVTPEVRSGTVFVPFFTREVEKQVGSAIPGGTEPAFVRVEKE